MSLASWKRKRKKTHTHVQIGTIRASEQLKSSFCWTHSAFYHLPPLSTQHKHTRSPMAAFGTAPARDVDKLLAVPDTKIAQRDKEYLVSKNRVLRKFAKKQSSPTGQGRHRTDVQRAHYRSRDHEAPRPCAIHD